MAQKPAPPSATTHNAKTDALMSAAHTVSNAGAALTTNNGLLIADDVNSLKGGGPRGPTLLEDFQLREKITHFDHGAYSLPL